MHTAPTYPTSMGLRADTARMDFVMGRQIPFDSGLVTAVTSPFALLTWGSQINLFQLGFFGHELGEIKPDVPTPEAFLRVMQHNNQAPNLDRLFILRKEDLLPASDNDVRYHELLYTLGHEDGGQTRFFLKHHDHRFGPGFYLDVAGALGTFKVAPEFDTDADMEKFAQSGLVYAHPSYEVEI